MGKILKPDDIEKMDFIRRDTEFNILGDIPSSVTAKINGQLNTVWSRRLEPFLLPLDTTQFDRAHVATKERGQIQLAQEHIVFRIPGTDIAQQFMVQDQTHFATAFWLAKNMAKLVSEKLEALTRERGPSEPSEAKDNEPKDSEDSEASEEGSERNPATIRDTRSHR